MEFDQRVRNNGVTLKNVPNTELEDGKFKFTDYVSKKPSSWAMVPENPDEVDVEALADEVHDIYRSLAIEFEEVSVVRREDDMHWFEVEIRIPDDDTRKERLAEQVAEAILSRQQL